MGNTLKTRHKQQAASLEGRLESYVAEMSHMASQEDASCAASKRALQQEHWQDARLKELEMRNAEMLEKTAMHEFELQRLEASIERHAHNTAMFKRENAELASQLQQLQHAQR